MPITSNFFRYLAVAYATATFWEIVAHHLDPLNLTFDQGMLVAVVGILIWYGLIYTVSYFLLRDRPVWIAVIAGAIFGTLLEKYWFGRSGLADPFVYAIMFWVPFAYLARQRRGETSPT